MRVVCACDCCGAGCAGTYDEPNCMWRSDDLDHAVAVVGYGTDDAGVDYWIVKNSWSSHWCAPHLHSPGRFTGLLAVCTH